MRRVHSSSFIRHIQKSDCQASYMAAEMHQVNFFGIPLKRSGVVKMADF